MKYRFLIILLVGIFVGCASQHEADLITNKQWHLLGEYYGEHGYQPQTEVVLNRMGATREIDKAEYYAGYDRGRSKFCFHHDERETWINPNYPSECGELRRNRASQPLGDISQGGY